MKTTKVLCALVIGMMIVSGIPMFATAQAVNDELVIALQADMQDVNPWNPDTNAVWKSNQIGWCFEGLMAYNPDYELYPVLAAKKATGPNGADATISEDGLTVTVNITQNVKFHDGHVMDSQDIVFSYQTLAWGLFQTQVLGPLYWDDGTTFARYDSTTATPTKTKIGVTASDADTVVFHLVDNYAMFWYLTMAVPIMPYHIWDAGTHVHTAPLAAGDFPGYNVTDEYGWDYSYGSKVTELDAATGTGPMKIESWVKEQGSVIVAFTDYWDKTGTTNWKGVNYPNYPQHVTKIRYKIYTQLDVAILALQNGDVHNLPWTLTPGYYNLLKNDPNIGIELNKDQGFFYMSFNQRKGAMADVNFRRAVSYCVDKQYIVDRLMGGYGIQGSVPISVTNTFYVNSSVPAWIAGGNLDAAKALLDASGYTDKDGDGWRDQPDGSPLKYNILTPPKDYDPIRADAGIMIEKNLKSIGLNIAAVPTSFNTIVSAASVSLEFDIYILGWTVGSFPESYLRDFFHSSSDVAVNPSGSNSAGYHNETVDTMINEMEIEMDTDARAKLIKDICGATMKDVAYDTLYYRTNIEAYRKDIWTGWVPAFGTIYNGFSIYNLAPPGSGGDTGGDDSGGGSATITGIESKINMPSMAGAGQTISGSIIATDVFESGTTRTTAPSVGATVKITTSFGKNITATTDAMGMASFDLTIPYQKINSVRIDANISKTGVWSNVNKTIGIEFTNHIAQLSLSTTDGVIAPGATTVVTAKVTDENGNPIAGVNVDVDKALMFGTVDAATKTTDATGIATFTYTAPPATMLPNQHRFEQFKANISVTNAIIPEVQSASLIIGISNSVYDWHSLDITGVTEYVIDNLVPGDFPASTAITLKLTDQTGADVPTFPVSMSLSAGNTIIDADAMMKSTSATGEVTFTLTVDAAFTGAQTVIATFNTSKAYSIKDSVAIYIRNDPTNNVTTYHLNITEAPRGMISNVTNTANTSVALVRLFNSTWKPVSGVDVYMGLSNTNTSFIKTSGEFNTTNATGFTQFNITCIADGSADLAIAFGVNESVGTFQGYNLKVNMSAATEKLPITNEAVYGPATGGETGVIGNLNNTPVLTAQIYKANGLADGVLMTSGVNYNLNLATGNITWLNELSAGDHIYAQYTYSLPFTNELVYTATGGETGVIGNLNNTPVLTAQIYKANGLVDGVLMTSGVNYNLNLATGNITWLNELSAGDHIYAQYTYSTAVTNETAISGAAGGETVLPALANTPLIDATVYKDNAGVWTKLTDTVEYNIVLSTGVITMTAPLVAGDNIYAYYNYSTAVGNETVFAGPALGGETGLLVGGNLNNLPIVNAQIRRNTVTLTDGVNYTLNLATGAVTLLNIVLVAGDNIYANYTQSVPVANETVSAPATGGETGLLVGGNLNNLPIVNAQIRRNAVWLTPAQFTVNPATGAVTLNITLAAGDNIYANYNYTHLLPNHKLSITSISSQYIDSNPFNGSTPGYSNIKVTLLDIFDVPIVNKTVCALTMTDNIALTKLYIKTDANGSAIFNVTSVSGIMSSAIVCFQVNDTIGYTQSVTLYNRAYKPGYAAGIDFTGISSNNASMDISATVYNEDGTPAVGVPCMLYIPLTSEGKSGVFQDGDSWGWTEYDGPPFGSEDVSDGIPDEWDLGWWASYIGSWLGDNATVTNAFGQLNATIDTASFLADVEIPLQFGVGGTGVAAGFNYSANNFWLEWPGPGSDTPPMTDSLDGPYYWEAAGFTMIDQAILKRAPMVTLTKAEMSQPFLSSADNTTTISLTFQNLTGALSVKKVNIGLGTAKPVILNTNTTSTVGVYTYDYTADPQSFDSGFGFTSVVKDAGYAKFPFNFYFPYLADGITAKTMVVTVEPAVSVLTIGQNIVLNATVTDEYGRIVTGATVVSGTQTATTDATGKAQLTISTASQTKTGLYTVLMDVTKGTMSTDESASVILVSAEPDMATIIIGPVLDKDSEPIEGALVSISIAATRQADTYTGLTNATGYATIEVPESYLGQEVTVTITKDGYDTITYTTTLNADGTQTVAPPTFEAEDEGGMSMALIAGIIIVILVVVLVVLFVVMPKMKAGKADEPEASKPEPKVEEKKPEEPIEEVLTKEAAPEELTPEKPE